jgi:hypothetical protein
MGQRKSLDGLWQTGDSRQGKKSVMGLLQVAQLAAIK